MKKLYVTFSGDFYHETTGKIVENAPKFGADQVLVYDDYWMDRYRPDFRKYNSWAWNHKATGVNALPGYMHNGRPDTRGVNWFIFKPFVITDALDRAQDGDVVLYTDADTFPITDLSPIYEIASRDGIMVFTVEGCYNRRWCKRDCFIIMGQDEPQYTSEDVQCAVARFIAVKKGPWLTKQFMAEWLTYCNPLANTFDLSVYAPEHPGFQEHRCEQAILTNLAHRYKLRLWREACGFGEISNRDREIYPQLFTHVNVAGNKTYGPITGQGSCYRNIND
jgi:hypothetical protein